MTAAEIAEEKVDVSIVITSLNGRFLLPACLASLQRQTYASVETILVDNGSTDGSGDYVKRNYPWVRVIRAEKNLGFAGGCNLGAASAIGNKLLFLSNDTVVTPDFLDELAGAMNEDPATGVVQSKMFFMHNTMLIDSIGAFFTRTGILFNPLRGQVDTYKEESPSEIFAAQGACMMIRADLFEEIGGFDDDYVVYFDDTDLCWRSWLAGYKVKVVPQSHIYHKGGGTTSDDASGEVVFHSFKNRLCSLLKNLALKDMVTIIPVHLAICVVGSGLFFSRKKPKSGLAILRAIIWNLVNLRRTSRKRRDVGDNSVVPRVELFPRLERRMPLSHLIHQGLSYSNEW